MRAVDAPQRASHGELVVLGRTAMACRFEVLLPVGDEEQWEAAERGLALVGDLEKQMSAYREDSEISEINRRAAGGAVRVERGLFALLQLSARLSEETAGAFDITTRPVGQVWKVCEQEGRLPRGGEVEGALAHVGMRHVVLDAARQTVEFRRSGVELNLGAIGKGYAVDRVAESLRADGVRNALVHAGHSSICALGSPPWGGRWVVSIRHPEGGGRCVARVHLRDQSMSTSGSGEQFFDIGGRRYGHIIDPRTGWPANEVLSATAIAATAAEADGLSTAFCVMGPEASTAFCERHPGVGALLVCRGESGSAVRVLSIGIPDEILEVIA